MKLFTPLLIFLTLNATGQSKNKFELKGHIIPVSMIVMAGIAEGIQDALAFHNNSKNHFWGYNSYLNKYKNHDPKQGQTFRGKYLTFTTDGYHLMKFTKNLFLMGAIAVKIGDKKKKWYKYIVEGTTYWILNRLAFSLTYQNIKIK